MSPPMSGASDVDVVVIGGGLAGTAVLRELACRGARVVLVEEADLGAAGSSLAMGTIDVRDLILQGRGDRAARDLRTREEALLVHAAPHLAANVPVIAIATEGSRGASRLARWDAALALRARQGETSVLLGLDARALRAREPALALGDDDAALVGTRVRIDGPRLALAYARDAIEQGAELRVRWRMTTATSDADGVRVVLASAQAGQTTELHARALVFATGASPLPVGARTSPHRERCVHVVLDHAITTHAIVAAGESIVPFHNVSVLSGRAIAFDGSAGESHATRDEVRALITSLARFVPDVQGARVVSTSVSVRRSSEGDAVAPPMFTMPHGTPWDARARAESVAMKVAARLGLDTRANTTKAKLPGGEEIVDSFDVAERLGMPEAAARRLTLRHGARCIDIGARIGRRRTEAAIVCACDPVLEAEVRHAVRVEHAHDVSDVCRRTRLGIGTCGGMRCAHRAAEIVAAERALGSREARDMARRFLVERWRARAPGLDAAALAQEELARARWVGASGIDEDPPSEAK